MSANMMIRSMGGQSIGNIMNKEKNSGSLQLNTGDRFFAEVIQSNNQEIRIGIDGQGQREELLLEMKNASQNFQTGDIVEIKVIESKKNMLKVAIEKIEVNQEEVSKNHDPNSDKVNVESTKKSLLQKEQDSNGKDTGSESMQKTQFLGQVKQVEALLSEKEYIALLRQGFDLTKMTVPMLNQFLQLHHKHSDGDFATSTVDKITKFAEKVDKVQQMDRQDIVKFLLSNKTATISEMYKSLYSAGKQMPDYVMSESDYEAIKESAHQIIDAVATDKPQEVQAITKELVMRGGALDERTLNVLSFLQEDHKGEDLMKMVAYQVENKAKLEDYSLSQAQVVKQIPSPQELKETLEDIKTITAVDIRRVVEQNKAITIEHLVHASTSEKIESEDPVVNQSLDLKVDQELENLNVIRYQMTFKAAMRLSLQGINIRTTPLPNLRTATETLVDEHLQTSSTQDLENATQKEVWASWQVSMARLNASSTQTITQSLGESEVSLNALMARAQMGADRYDTLRTEVRPDLGDRIDKAFSNVNTILKDLGLETTLFNQRAVQILGRNGMDLTLENIRQVKQIDLPLQELQKMMMPEHILSFLKEGKDILTMSLSQLTEEVAERSQQEGVNPLDRMIKELHQVLKSAEVAETAKDALVGVYRLMHTISSAHNAAVGFLVDRKLPVTLENLFEASKYIQQSRGGSGKMEVAIDDSTGLLESINQEGPSIIEQIATGYYEKSQEVKRFLDYPMKHSHDVAAVIEEIQQEIEAMDYEKVRNILEKVQQNLGMDSQLMEENLMGLNLHEFDALNQLQKDPFTVKALMKELLATSRVGEESPQSMAPLFEAYINDLASPQGQNNEVYKAMKAMKDSFFEKIYDMQEKEEWTIKSDRSFSEVADDLEAHSRMEEKLIDDHSYHTLPIMMNNQVQQMNVYYYEHPSQSEDAQDASSIYMRFTTEHMGTANIRVSFSDRLAEKVQVTMYASLETGTEKMQAYEGQIRQVLDGLDLSVEQVRYDSFDFPQPLKISQEEGMRSQHIRRYQDSQFEKVV